MKTQFTVRSSEAADSYGAVPEVVSSLPMSLHPTTGGRADLVAVAGIGRWPQQVQEIVASGARGVLVIEPPRADVTSLVRETQAAGVPVVIDTTWAYNPAVAAAAPHFQRLNEPDSLLESRVNVSVTADLEMAMLAQLALIRAAVEQVVSLRIVHTDRHGYEALARLANGARASLSAVTTNSVDSSAYLRIIKPRHAVEAIIPAPISAAAGLVTVSGPEGATLLKTSFETAHRGAWKQLHSLAHSGRLSGDLLGFALDLALLSSGFPSSIPDRMGRDHGPV